MNKKYLSKEQELELGRIIQKYKNYPKDTEEYKKALRAHNELFNNNIDAVYDLVHKFLRKIGYNNSYEMEDAIQDGLCELSAKIWEYNPEYNTICMTRITYNINKILCVKANKSRQIPFSVLAADKLLRIKEYIDQETQITNELLEEISKNTKIAKDDIIALINATMPSVSIYKKSEDGEGYLNIINPIEDLYPSTKNSEVLEELINELPEKDRKFIRREYFLDIDNLTQLEYLRSMRTTDKELQKQHRAIINKLREIAKQKGMRVFGNK